MSDTETDTPQLKFAEKHLGPIQRQQKKATIRLASDLWLSEYKIGQRFHICDADGNRIASAIVSDRGYNDALALVEYGVEGHRDYSDVEGFLEEMAEYYPDAELTPETCFKVIYWEDIWQ